MAISARKFCLWIRLFCHIKLTLLFLQKKAEARGFHRCLCFVHFAALPRLFTTPCTVPVEPAFCRVWGTAHQTIPAILRTHRHPAGPPVPGTNLGLCTSSSSFPGRSTPWARRSETGLPQSCPLSPAGSPERPSSICRYPYKKAPRFKNAALPSD